MPDVQNRLSNAEAKGLRSAKELERHVAWLDTFTPPALGVLAVASGIYTYIGVTSLLEDTGLMSFLAAVAYSVAVSVGIFVFWSYMLRLLPAMRNMSGFLALTLSTVVGSIAIIAMSSWLNAAALAGSAAVEPHLIDSARNYQDQLEHVYDVALAGQELEREVVRAKNKFNDLSSQELGGDLSGTAGAGAVYRVLTQKSDELAALEKQISDQRPQIVRAWESGNEILSRMRSLTASPGPVEQRSVQFAEDSVRLAGEIAMLKQLSVAKLVARAAEDLPASVVLPDLDRRVSVQQAQSSTIESIRDALNAHSQTLKQAADQVLQMEAPEVLAYTSISTATAVIRYRRNFVPSWAGAIAIDLLPGVLVFVLATTQAAIRRGKEGLGTEDTITIAELRASINAMKEIEVTMGDVDMAIDRRVKNVEQPSEAKTKAEE